MKGATDHLLCLDQERLDMPLVESAGYHGIFAAIPSRSRSTPAFHVTYVASQETTWLLQSGLRLTIQSGQLGLISPEEVHQGQWAVDHPNVHYWFHFLPGAPEAARWTPFQAENLKKAYRVLQSKGSMVVTAPAGYAELCEKFRHHLQSSADDDFVWMRLILAQIFWQSVEAFSEPVLIDRQRMQHILQLIDERISEWPNVAAIASCVQMDEGAFHRFFRQEMGMSPWNYVIRARCHRACDYLRAGQLSMTAIAHELGFSSSQHFSTVFRRFVGHTPKQFRSLHAEYSLA